MSRVPSRAPVKRRDDDYVIDKKFARKEDNDTHDAKVSQRRKKHSKCTFSHAHMQKYVLQFISTLATSSALRGVFA